LVLLDLLVIVLPAVVTLYILELLLAINLRPEATLLHSFLLSQHLLLELPLLSLRDVSQVDALLLLAFYNKATNRVDVRLESVLGLLLFSQVFYFAVLALLVHNGQLPHPIFQTQILIFRVSLHDILADSVDFRLETIPR
jgi:hypothetical protein